MCTEKPLLLSYKKDIYITSIPYLKFDMILLNVSFSYHYIYSQSFSIKMLLCLISKL